MESIEPDKMAPRPYSATERIGFGSVDEFRDYVRIIVASWKTDDQLRAIGMTYEVDPVCLSPHHAKLREQACDLAMWAALGELNEEGRPAWYRTRS